MGRISSNLLILFSVCSLAFAQTGHVRRLTPNRPRAFDFAADVNEVVGEIHDDFSCDGRDYGYYADQFQDCQVFHICMPVKAITGRTLDTFQFSFFCPSHTRFSQESRTCISEASAFPCDKAHLLYDLNKSFGEIPDKKTDGGKIIGSSNILNAPTNRFNIGGSKEIVAEIQLENIVDAIHLGNSLSTSGTVEAIIPPGSKITSSISLNKQNAQKKVTKPETTQTSVTEETVTDFSIVESTEIPIPEQTTLAQILTGSATTQKPKTTTQKPKTTTTKRPVTTKKTITTKKPVTSTTTPTPEVLEFQDALEESQTSPPFTQFLGTSVVPGAKSIQGSNSQQGIVNANDVTIQIGARVNLPTVIQKTVEIKSETLPTEQTPLELSDSLAAPPPPLSDSIAIPPPLPATVTTTEKISVKPKSSVEFNPSLPNIAAFSKIKLPANIRIPIGAQGIGAFVTPAKPKPNTVKTAAKTTPKKVVTTISSQDVEIPTEESSSQQADEATTVQPIGLVMVKPDFKIEDLSRSVSPSSKIRGLPSPDSVATKSRQQPSVPKAHLGLVMVKPEFDVEDLTQSAAPSGLGMMIKPDFDIEDLTRKTSQEQNQPGLMMIKPDFDVEDLTRTISASSKIRGSNSQRGRTTPRVNNNESSNDISATGSRNRIDNKESVQVHPTKAPRLTSRNRGNVKFNAGNLQFQAANSGSVTRIVTSKPVNQAKATKPANIQSRKKPALPQVLPVQIDDVQRSSKSLELEKGNSINKLPGIVLDISTPSFEKLLVVEITTPTSTETTSTVDPTESTTLTTVAESNTLTTLIESPTEISSTAETAEISTEVDLELPSTTPKLTTTKERKEETVTSSPEKSVRKGSSKFPSRNGQNRQVTVTPTTPVAESTTKPNFVRARNNRIVVTEASVSDQTTTQPQKPERFGERRVLRRKVVADATQSNAVESTIVATSGKLDNTRSPASAIRKLFKSREENIIQSEDAANTESPVIATKETISLKSTARGSTFDTASRIVKKVNKKRPIFNETVTDTITTTSVPTTNLPAVDEIIPTEGSVERNTTRNLFNTGKGKKLRIVGTSVESSVSAVSSASKSLASTSVSSEADALQSLVEEKKQEEPKQEAITATKQDEELVEIQTETTEKKQAEKQEDKLTEKTEEKHGEIKEQESSSLSDQEMETLSVLSKINGIQSTPITSTSTDIEDSAATTVASLGSRPFRTRGKSRFSA